MVGVNIGRRGVAGVLSFLGWKDSFFGDLHVHGWDAVEFFTRKKTVTSRYFSAGENGKILSSNKATRNKNLGERFAWRPLRLFLAFFAVKSFKGGCVQILLLRVRRPLRNSPAPARPRNLSPSTITRPRDSTTSGMPVTSIPSNIE